jgi:DNA adenine methylase
MYAWLLATPHDTLTDIQRAARFYYLQKGGFGGKVDGRSFGTATTSGPRLNLLRIEEELSEAHLRLCGAYIEHLAWDACVKRYDRPHSLFYMDPPYWGTEGYGVEFGLEQYSRMAELAGSIEGRMVISVNDIPQMREIFAGLNTQRVEVSYQVGGKGRKNTKSGELIVTNF